MWRAVPVINENDTTATDEITFGDNDFLAAQVALLLDARALVLLTDTAGPAHRRPRVATPTRELIERVDDFSELAGLRDRRPDVALRLGRDAQQGGRGGDGDAAGIEVVVCDGTRRDAAARRRGRGRGHAFPAHPGRAPSFKLWLRYAKPSRGRWRSMPGAARVLRERGSSLLPVGIVGGRGRLRGRRRRRRRLRLRLVGKGIVNYSAGELARIKGMKSAEVLELMPHASEEAVHRDFFVLA